MARQERLLRRLNAADGEDRRQPSWRLLFARVIVFPIPRRITLTLLVYSPHGQHLFIFCLVSVLDEICTRSALSVAHGIAGNQYVVFRRLYASLTYFQHLPKHASLPELQLLPENRPIFRCRNCGFVNTLLPLCLWCTWSSREAEHEFRLSTPRSRRVSAPCRVLFSINVCPESPLLKAPCVSSTLVPFSMPRHRNGGLCDDQTAEDYADVSTATPPMVQRYTRHAHAFCSFSFLPCSILWSFRARPGPALIALSPALVP